MTNIKYTITRQEEFTAVDMGLNELSELGGCSDNGEAWGLDSWQYEFDVGVTNQVGETQSFTVVFQTEERNNGLQNYAGDEITTAGAYGCDADESSELEVFCEYDTFVINELHKMAQKAATAELECLLAESD